MCTVIPLPLSFFTVPFRNQFSNVHNTNLHWLNRLYVLFFFFRKQTTNGMEWHDIFHFDGMKCHLTLIFHYYYCWIEAGAGKNATTKIQEISVFVGRFFF